ncbi:winged helix family two component transcriptional regulator [Desulfitobacterium sp. LBE]|uniref:Stage 0 sporulation protein A homolog n=4 Tax=root TaxID=1 RepID=Q24QA5_DESHY|nr:MULTISPECIES: response regulator transcription factor [Desulfitobacterium]EHL04067.1 putative transcriptional regulatory protein ResD [Desulfitobacterium hafniense DP7]KTE90906.1 two-component system response regulator [Desulfitobacterium hafniense]MEA5025118.1 response regulator transcription factor [Desulfitobacterium hafniense]TWH57717.1 winged helix family two component transcriptional regulator [Desulfitobacterium sp. LBE]CDX04218.1 Transcriptional regulatory protein ResD [Desulfitobac
MRILLVDDEKNISNVLKAYLQQEGFHVTTAVNGLVALTLFKENSYDLVLLDLMLPGLSGEEICREIRKISATPVIMLTAKVELEDRLQGLNLGADDYIGKPFSPREVVARIKAVLRRTHIETSLLADSITYDNGLTIDNAQHEVRLQEEVISLTPTEFKILGALAKYPGRVYSRGQLVQIVQGHDFGGDERVIDAHIKKLRQKLERVPSDPKIILTVYGVGYKFNAHKEE